VRLETVRTQQPRLTLGDLEAAIASLTRALATASGDAVVVLAAERAALRAELGIGGSRPRAWRLR